MKVQKEPMEMQEEFAQKRVKRDPRNHPSKKVRYATHNPSQLG